VIRALALVALLLAGVGIHGLLAYQVSRRAPEIGVRMALGAGSTDIVTMVVRQGASLPLAGSVPGLALAFAAGRSMEALLAGVEPGDPATFLVIAGLCLLMAIVGCLAPAVRAVRVDASAVIKAE